MSFDSPLPPYNASDPTATFLNSSCLDLLMIELVPMAYRIVNEIDSSDPPPPSANPSSTTTSQAQSPTQSRKGDGSLKGGAGAVGVNGSRKMDEEEERDAVFYRLEMLGYRVGQGLVERFSKDRPRFTDTLDVIKFLCKDLWMLVFRKQIDNLKTNHRGVYVLTDNSFRPFSRMSTEAGGQAVVKAQPFLYFPCGIIRGALASMGINANVQAETSELPGATFQVKALVAKT
ncbi:trafficking protein particle complex subunit 6A [Hyaloscypha bicolor E]|uniref:Trafficking protein particle complex subunit 6A n=1 Tax=Hyaloscypha bicolor E TaxID=1095630 RepID=A0A2J6SF19_9HELO|nr:trafficking protein particle complex subunit 6A [Hyaloscypha bicolor E]PMD49349.1 trafficking protein particle complex subunit 6A [Hyaloscypha bicolor E]